MSVNVYIPTPFRHLVGNRAAVSAEGTTVMDVFESLDTQFPGFHAQLFDGGGALAQHISVYVNQVEIRSLEGMSTNMSEGDELAVIPALAGGADVSLTPDMVERYSRHLIMPQVGSIQTTEVLKLILGVGEPLVNRLLLYDALSLEFRIVKIRRDPECPLCGDNPTLDELIDYEAFCGVPLEHAISNG